MTIFSRILLHYTSVAILHRKKMQGPLLCNAEAPLNYANFVGRLLVGDFSDFQNLECNDGEMSSR